MPPVLSRSILLLAAGAGLALACALYPALALVADAAQPRTMTLPALGLVLAFAASLVCILVRTSLAIRRAHATPASQ